ncbi:bactofilin family protein [Ferrovibrio xuzhouensis]|uniref:Polymer-forming cytoskeletal protein n=1 Tax=Ferrovibrio xuzhouensis TaxID=1576914 RepID=A0ABV7VDJ8_9PROT
MFGRKKPTPDTTAHQPPLPMPERGPTLNAAPPPAVTPIRAADDDLPPMPSHLRAVGKPVLPAASTPPSSPPPSSPTGAAMTDTPTPTPTFRPEIAKRPNVDLPKAVVQASAGSSAPRSEGSPEAKVLLIGRDISLNGKITACDKVIVEGKVEADLTDSRFVEIAETGMFKGSAEVEEAEIRGHFEGRLSVRGRLLIRGTGKVAGDIAYGQVEIECGGEISGTVQTVAAGGRKAAPAAAE